MKCFLMMAALGGRASRRIGAGSHSGSDNVAQADFTRGAIPHPRARRCLVPRARRDPPEFLPQPADECGDRADPRLAGNSIRCGWSWRLPRRSALRPRPPGLLRRPAIPGAAHRRDVGRGERDVDAADHRALRDLPVEARWSGGRMLREYTVLLDPPTFLPAPEAAPAPAAPAVDAPRPAPANVRRGPAPTPAPVVTPAPARDLRRRGVRSGAAQRYAVGDRPAGAADAGLTTNQVMVALFRANPTPSTATSTACAPGPSCACRAARDGGHRRARPPPRCAARTRPGAPPAAPRWSAAWSLRRRPRRRVPPPRPRTRSGTPPPAAEAARSRAGAAQRAGRNPPPHGSEGCRDRCAAGAARRARVRGRPPAAGHGPSERRSSH
jgi:hypothetical protein